jgi:hypothetical protein
VESFSFTFDQLAMIVLPKSNEHQQYFTKFISKDAKNLKFPGSIPVVPWEDLIEH